MSTGSGRGGGSGIGRENGNNRAHPDPADLALAALPDEPPDPAVTAHLTGCARCREHVAALARTVALAQDGSGDVDARPVPERVWAAIAAELGPELDLATDLPTWSSTDHDRTRPTSGARSGHDHGTNSLPAGPVGRGAAAQVPSSPRFRPWRAAAAVLAVLAVGVGVGVGVDRAVRPAGSPPTIVVAQLSSVGAAEPAGRGTLATAQHDGVRTMTIHLTGVADPAGADFLEAWLMDPTAHQIVALGALTRDGAGYDGTFTVPANLPTARLDVVDVSAERYDGDPGHSGVSLLRGTLS